MVVDIVSYSDVSFHHFNSLVFVLSPFYVEALFSALFLVNDKLALGPTQIICTCFDLHVIICIKRDFLPTRRLNFCYILYHKSCGCIK
jgi:hypothetical protein